MDVDALLASANGMARVPLFLALLLLVRGVPAFLYRRQLGGRERLLLALFSSTTLPLVVVIAGIGKATGRMLPENAAALVGAGILSVLIFPLVALTSRARQGREDGTGDPSGAAGRCADAPVAAPRR